ncbi:hypothetical protein DFP72DRAFT_1068142 [Ephemerocybe angulata]|uniref:F-box domain-containing protein n=1 Tax=Ephemerocybe angulata TaxID=980116 RepID=A0A8H6HXF3_9AGAR|nr:hypothetical protein DFP72DRAFT_1068142 [Tulosesus angulatus]
MSTPLDRISVSPASSDDPMDNTYEGRMMGDDAPEDTFHPLPKLLKYLPLLENRLFNVHQAALQLPRNNGLPIEPLLLERLEGAMSLCLQFGEKVEVLGQEILERSIPIYNLPDEILRMIFWFCQPDSWSVDGLDNNECPKTLTKVCHKWRTVAFEYGNLWSWITLPLNYDSEYLEEKCKYSLQHVGFSPINLRIVWGYRPMMWDDDSDANTSLTVDAVERLAKNFVEDIISRFSTGIKTLALDSIPSPILAALPAGHFPHLVTLEWMQWLEHDDSDEEEWDQLGLKRGPIIAFRDCPKLRRLGLKRQELKPFDIELSWSQLSHVSGSYSTLALQHLAAGNSLRCVDLYHWLAGKPSSSGGALPLDFGGVKTLSLTVDLPETAELWYYEHPSGAEELAFSDSLLQLEFRHLQSFWLWDYGNRREFVRTLRRSTETWFVKNLKGVNILGLGFSTITADALTPILRAAPETTTLLVDGGCENWQDKRKHPPHFLTALQHKLGWEVLLPKLHTLVIDIRNCYFVAEKKKIMGSLRKVLLDRVRHSTPFPTRLRRLIVHMDERREHDELRIILPTVQPFIEKHGLLFDPVFGPVAEEPCVTEFSNILNSYEPDVEFWEPEISCSHFQTYNY